MNLSVNNLLKGRYRIESILGQGGMGAVYKATDELLGVSVAVKENLFLSEEYSLQFREEARILASLRHLNLPRVLDFCSIEGQGQYLVMDYVEGEDLRDLLKQSGPLSERDVVLIGYHISDALQYMHSQNPMVVHRDVKPGNIKLTSSNKIYLVDFGLAKQTSSRSEMTMTGARAMTPGFSPPEQYGTARTDERSDIYSLGATLYNALTGVIPEDALDRVTEKNDLTPILNHRRDTERRLVRVIEKAMALNPNDRYQSAKEFQDALLHSARLQSITTGLTQLHKFDLNRIYESSEKPIPPRPSGLKNGKSSSFYPKKKNPWVRWAIIAVVVFMGLGLLSMQAGWLNNRFAWQTTETPEALVFLSTPSTANSEEIVFTKPAVPSVTLSLTASPEPSQTELPTMTETVIVTRTSTQDEPEQKSTLTPTVDLTFTPTLRAFGIRDEFPIVFASNRSGANQLWLMNETGKDVFRLTNMIDGACQPNWSPDGTQIAFVSPCNNAVDEYPDGILYVYSFEEKNIIPLLELEEQNKEIGNFDPEWSPDGSKLAFSSLRDGVSAINIYDFSTKEMQVLTEPDIKALHPSWHPDGTSIIFVVSDFYSTLWKIDIDGTNLVEVSSSGNVSNFHPVWDQEGKYILFSQRGGAQVPWLVKLYAANFGSKLEDRIATDGVSGTFPVSSPVFIAGNEVILFESWPDGKNHDIYTMLVDGSDLSRLTTSTSYDFDPDFFFDRLEPEGETDS